MDIFIIGSGNVATSIGKAILKTEHNICGVWSRNTNTGRKLSKKLGCGFIQEIGNIRIDYDVYLIAVKDDVVEVTAKLLTSVKGIVIHTSGSIPMLSTAQKNGVIYPVETISASNKVNYRKVPFCIEASDELSLKQLQQFASSLSDHVYQLNSNQRATLHLSAVFANNFTNYLFGIANNILKTEQLPKELIQQLIKSTAANASKSDPFKIQTGPARRNDREVINKQLNQLSAYPDYQAIYKLLSEQLIKLYQLESSNNKNS